MAIVYKESSVQGTAAVGTYATLYQCPAATTAVVGLIGICNTAATSATFRISVMATAGTPTTAEAKTWDTVVAPNDTLSLSLGLVVGASRFVRVSSSANTVSFFAAVSEITA